MNRTFCAGTLKRGARIDLRKVGASKYAADPSTEVICYELEHALYRRRQILFIEPLDRSAVEFFAAVTVGVQPFQQPGSFNWRKVASHLKATGPQQKMRPRSRHLQAHTRNRQFQGSNARVVSPRMSLRNS